MQTYSDAAAGASVTLGAKHTINSVRIDNPTSQWLQFVGQISYVPPYTYGAIYATPGLGAVAIQSSPPGGATQQAIIAGERYSVTLSSDVVPSSPGFSVNIRPPIFLAIFVGTLYRVPGAAGWNSVFSAGNQLGADLQGGVKRMTIKALDGNLLPVYIEFDTAARVAVPPADALPFELGAGEAQTWPYQYWGPNGVVIATSARAFGQFYVQNATDGISITWAV